MDSTDSWENILSELDLTDHRQDLAAAGYDNLKARAAHSDISFKAGWEIEKKCGICLTQTSTRTANHFFSPILGPLTSFLSWETRGVWPNHQVSQDDQVGFPGNLPQMIF